MHRGHVVAVSTFCFGSIGFWIDAVADMGMCWAVVGSGGAGVGDGICMWL